MTGSDMVLILITFLVGIFAGGYLYVGAFAPTYRDSGIEPLSAFEIIGDQYGGCERGASCSSFILREDRSFVYIKGSITRDEEATMEGKLDRGIFNDLRRTLTEVDLKMLSERITPRTCASHADGIDYRYRVLYGDAEYTLDTCATRFGSLNPELMTLLGGLWSTMGEEDVER